jgi:hypothetical protein
VGGKGYANGEPLFFLKANAALKGLTVFYPEQDAKTRTRTRGACGGRGDNVAVVDVLLVNPWNGRGLRHPPVRPALRLGPARPAAQHRPVRRPVPRLRAGRERPLLAVLDERAGEATRAAGTAFRFARTDWQMLSNVFCLGYRTGFHFTAVRHDAGNALVTNSGADLCDVGVRVEYSQVHAGLLFTNCQINAGVVIEPGASAR